MHRLLLGCHYHWNIMKVYIDQVLCLPDPVKQSSDVYHCADETDVAGTRKYLC